MSMKELREREKENRREYILDQAEMCFRRTGFDDVSMEDIANEVGMNRTTLYLYFKDKEALFSEVVLRGMKTMHAMMMEAGNSTPDTTEKVLEMGDAMIAYMQQYPDNYRLQRYFLSGRFDPAKMDQNGAGAQICQLRKEIYARFSRRVREGIENGTFKKEIHPIEIAVLVCQLLSATVSMNQQALAVLERHGIDRERFLSDTRQLIASMLKNPVP
jgi:TetR/AcrR family transcriptional regulator